MKRAKRTIVIISLALASCRGPVYSPTMTPQVFNVRLIATVSTAPLLAEWVEAYGEHAALIVDLSSVGWPAAQAQVLSGRVAYAATLSLAPDPALWAAPIAIDGIALIVHPSNPIPALTREDLRALFLGRAAAWTVLGGPALPVTVVSAETGDDLRQGLELLALGGGRITQGARLALSPRSMIDLVAGEPGAIGYVALSALTGAAPGSVRIVPIDPGTGEPPVLPTPAARNERRYPLRLPVSVVGRQAPPPDSPYYALFAWMQSDEGQAFLAERLAAPFDTAAP